jgi:hypothetical protein
MNVEEVLTAVHTMPAPSLGIDLDGTIDESPAFFSMLTRIWPGNIYIITYRDDPNIEADLNKFHIKFTEIVSVASFAQKAKEIEKRGISVFFDDMDEVLLHIPSTVTVLKVRNEGNFDFDDKRWLYSKHTGKQL